MVAVQAGKMKLVAAADGSAAAATMVAVDLATNTFKLRLCL